MDQQATVARTNKQLEITKKKSAEKKIDEENKARVGEVGEINLLRDELTPNGCLLQLHMAAEKFQTHTTKIPQQQMMKEATRSKKMELPWYNEDSCVKRISRPRKRTWSLMTHRRKRQK